MVIVPSQTLTLHNRLNQLDKTACPYHQALWSLATETKCAKEALQLLTYLQDMPPVVSS